MGLEVWCQMASVVEALLANGAGVSSWYFVLLVGVFSGVMLLEVIFSVKALVTQWTSKAGRLAMRRLSMSPQRFLAGKCFAAHVAHRPLSGFLGWQRWQR